MNFFHENGRFQRQSDGCPCCEVRLIDLFTAEGNSNRTLSRPKGKARRKNYHFSQDDFGDIFQVGGSQRASSDFAASFVQYMFFFAKFLVPILKKDN